MFAKMNQNLTYHQTLHRWSSFFGDLVCLNGCYYICYVTLKNKMFINYKNTKRKQIECHKRRLYYLPSMLPTFLVGLATGVAQKHAQ
ncbi:hypothetical protein Hanom_Chr15g01376631 [Helianthus anomalus]